MVNIPLNEETKPNQYFFFFYGGGVSSHGIVANVLDCDIIVNEFKLQSHYIQQCYTQNTPFFVYSSARDTVSVFSTNKTTKFKREYDMKNWTKL